MPPYSRGNNNKKWSNSNNTGGRVSSNGNSSHPSPVHKQGGYFTEDGDMMKHMHDRMLFLLVNLIGSVVQVTVRNGTKFEGVFHAASTEGDLGVTLKLARKIYDPSEPHQNGKINPHPVKNTLLLFGRDVVEVNAVDVDLTVGDSPLQARDTFKTDVDISGKSEVKERELHKWNPEGHGNDGEALGSLEGDTHELNGTGSWDQFAANEKLFGLKTDFNEEIYTTRLDRSAPDYKDREKRAIEMANEIQRATSSNVHILEERGVITDDSGMDEEDRYGAVVRETNPSKYLPPALRKHAQQKPTKEEQIKKDTTFGNVPPDSPLHKLLSGNLPKAVVAESSSVSNLRHELNGAHGKGALEKKPDTERIEAEIATTFRQFAMLEKDKLHAKKQALQKKEKDGRLAELMKFHQTFKLNVPVPPDLVPLLSKGKKQTSPTKANASLSSPSEKNADIPAVTSKNEEPKKTVDTKVPINDKKQATPPAKKAEVEKNETQKPTTESKQSTSGFKFNVKASEFKPNPDAPVFVPGGLTGPDDNSTNRSTKKNSSGGHLTAAEVLGAPFSDDDSVSPDSVGPTWPFGQKPYRHQFNQFAHYDDDMFAGYPSQGYPYGYPPQYRYPQQYMPVPQPGHVPYMSPQFVPNVPLTAPIPPSGAPQAVAYSPQMANASPRGSPFPHGFPSPQRSPMAPPHPVYQQYQGNPPPGAPMMVHMIQPNMMQQQQQQQQPRPIPHDHYPAVQGQPTSPRK
ncbi:hypothetical protein DFQ28_008516 [Apophysomyces sp. BC1034]|nr:hypothetical protein DFQ30_011204 [Apophysomyces sp. BC1015]KAG0179740.1 hypothetical protein DFQ29_001718 [Apophysomyces sp. BC1021]KAG0185968.1 hypothetical protein DFQ28_008516 [Apophysomyces sp. BC1034]